MWQSKKKKWETDYQIIDYDIIYIYIKGERERERDLMIVLVYHFI